MSADGPVIAVVGRSPRNWLHSADVLVYDSACDVAAWVWLATVFGRYPGCAAAVVRQPDRLVLVIRGQGWGR